MSTEGILLIGGGFVEVSLTPVLNIALVSATCVALVDRSSEYLEYGGGCSDSIDPIGLKHGCIARYSTNDEARSTTVLYCLASFFNEPKYPMQ